MAIVVVTAIWARAGHRPPLTVETLLIVLRWAYDEFMPVDQIAGADIRTAIRLMTEASELLARALETGGQFAAGDEEEDRVGHIAYLHLLGEREKGSPLTIAESLEIRRPFYGSRIQGSAALFGTEESNHILYRAVDHGTPRRESDPVALTEEGIRRAEGFARARGLDV